MLSRRSTTSASGCSRRTSAQSPQARIVPSLERQRAVVEGLEGILAGERVPGGVRDARSDDRGHVPHLRIACPIVRNASGRCRAPQARSRAPGTASSGVAAQQPADLRRCRAGAAGRRGGDAEGRHQLAAVAEHRHADAADSLLVLLVVDGIAAGQRELELGGQLLGGCQGARRAGHQLTGAARQSGRPARVGARRRVRRPGQQRLAGGARVRGHVLADRREQPHRARAGACSR